MSDTPDYEHGILDKGFRLAEVVEINVTTTIPAGAAAQVDLYTAKSGYFDELLCMIVQSNQVPAAAPKVNVEYVIFPNILQGMSRDLTLGYGEIMFYELDLSQRRLFAYRKAGVYGRFQALLAAHAVNNTTFNIYGLMARYALP